MPVPQDSFFVVEQASCLFPGRAGKPVNIFLGQLSKIKEQARCLFHQDLLLWNEQARCLFHNNFLLLWNGPESPFNILWTTHN
ncbi:hypothetical protein QUB70_05720 [Microcoleus sp. A003_D6]|uniref:hypothetical protein n=1 Tax=Microcoleus sp. A003_D6 TaxID=3055266 RepID=UPI002FD0EC5A